MPFMESKFINKLECLFDNIINGIVPLRTAKEARETGRVRAMNLNSQVRAAEMGYKDAELEKMQEAMDKAFKSCGQENR